MLDTLTRPGSAGQVSAPIVEVPTISGRFLAHAKLTPSQRARQLLPAFNSANSVLSG